MSLAISISDAGKRYNREWIFRHLNLELKTGMAVAITGSNGSGKSTLLQCIAGAIGLSEGKVAFAENDKPVAEAAAHQYLSLAAPYLELVEEMTLREFMHFHAQFKPLYKDVSVEAAAEAVGLERAISKAIVHFSSGMKQRLKLAQAFFSDVPLLLLDEPTSNLDAAGIAIYHQLINNYTSGRIVLVSSNDPQEYAFCNTTICMADYKT